MPLPQRSGAAGTVLALDTSKCSGEAAAVSACGMGGPSNTLHTLLDVGGDKHKVQIHLKSKFHYFATQLPIVCARVGSCGMLSTFCCRRV